jgi:hypothetical protein
MKRQWTLSLVSAVVLCFATVAGPRPWMDRTVHAGAESSSEPLLVLPAELNPQRWGTARCNDGTPFGFVLEPSPSGSNDWVIYLEGGCFCEDNASPCSRRGEKYTTMPGEEAMQDWYRLRDKALFSRDPEWNPTFYSANIVFAFYCSSDVWSGSTVERRPSSGDPEGWYFSGRINVLAMLQVLTQSYGLDDRNLDTRVLYAGGSAGGEGVQATADLVQKVLPTTARSGRLKLLNDAGSVFEFDDPDYSFQGTGQTFPEVMNQAYDFWGSRLNPLCEASMRRLGASPGACFDEVVVYPFLVQPQPNGLGLTLFVQHSSIDGFQLRAHGIRNPDGTELFRNNTLARFDGVPWTWLFSGGSMAYHVVTIRNDRWAMGPPGSTFREVLGRYWEGGPPEVVIYGNP